MRSKKTQGWEKRLAEYIQSVRFQKFDYKVHNCAMFAGRCVDVMTGADYTSEFIGQYKTRGEAYAFLKSAGYNDLEAIPRKFFGDPLPHVSYAQRGDVALIHNNDMFALGIVSLSGQTVLSVGVNGLVHLPLSEALEVWRV